MSIIVFNFAENILYMGILGTIDRCIHSVQSGLIEGNIVYIELDKDTYDTFLKEVDEKVNAMAEISTTEFKKQVADIGVCTVLSYMGYKIVVSVNKDKNKMDTFYFAFKTKVI